MKPVYGVISWDRSPVPRIMKDEFQCDGCDKWWVNILPARYGEDMALCDSCESMENELLVQRHIVRHFMTGGSIDEGYVILAWQTWMAKYLVWLEKIIKDSSFESQILKPMEMCIRDGKLTTDLSIVFPDLSMRRRLWAAIAEPFKEGRNISSIRVELGLDNRPRQYRGRIQGSSLYDLSVSRDQIEEAERRQSRVRVQERPSAFRGGYDAVPSPFEPKPKLEETAEKPRRKFSFDET